MSNKIEYLGVRIRVIAQIIDNVVLFASLGLFQFVVFGTWIRHIPDVATTFATDSICLSFLAVYFIYFVLLEGTIGATIGKLVCKIRVRNENGDACGVWEAFVRNILRVIDGLAFFSGYNLNGNIRQEAEIRRQNSQDRCYRECKLR